VSKALSKEVGLITAASIVTGCVIGSGVFVKPGRVLAATGNSSLALWAWVIGAIITIAGGLTIAEVSTRIPKTGGIYIYIEEIYGRTIGFLCGWVLTLVYGPAVMSALALYFGSLLANFLHLTGPKVQLTIAVTTTVFLSSLSIFGTRYAGALQAVSTVAKLIPIFVIAIAGILLGREPVTGVASGLPVAAGMGAAVLATLWAYDGWVNVGTMAGEMKNPSRDLPLAIILGLSMVAVAYLLVNIAIFHIVPAAQVASLNDRAAVVASERIFGGFGATLIQVGILISIFGCLNGNILATTRVPYAMGVRGDLPLSSWVGKAHPTFGTPYHAIMLQTTVALLMVMTGNPDLITDIGISAVYVFYVLAFAGIVKLRRDKVGENLAKYRTPLYPIVPGVAVVGGLYIIGSTVMNQPRFALYAFLLTLAGLPVFYGVQRARRSADS
jgi:APA family basic amino acid/polyamine antiporter